MKTWERFEETQIARKEKNEKLTVDVYKNHVTFLLNSFPVGVSCMMYTCVCFSRLLAIHFFSIQFSFLVFFALLLNDPILFLV